MKGWEDTEVLDLTGRGRGMGQTQEIDSLKTIGKRREGWIKVTDQRDGSERVESGASRRGRGAYTLSMGA